MHKKDLLQKRTTAGTSLELMDHKIEEMEVNADDKKKHEESNQRRKVWKAELEIKKKKCFEFLKDFVALHICVMLEKLYSKIAKEEEGLRDITTKCEGDRPTFKDVLNFYNAKKTELIELEKIWYAALYVAADPSTADQIRIVGPVGERPLHVCALSASRFEHLDVKMFGNYLSEGILQGMMDYINGAGVKGWNEATSQYGKDYCAAVGGFLLEHEGYDGVLADNEQAIQSLPFWFPICRWKKAHLRSRSPWCCWGDAPHPTAHHLVSTGVYEGETILFPLIAGKNEDIIQQLFAKEREVRVQKERDPPVFSIMHMHQVLVKQREGWEPEERERKERDRQGQSASLPVLSRYLALLRSLGDCSPRLRMRNRLSMLAGHRGGSR
jgi:hypothetical protein